MMNANAFSTQRDALLELSGKAASSFYELRGEKILGSDQTLIDAINAMDLLKDTLLPV
jgi:hypothetical protein